MQRTDTPALPSARRRALLAGLLAGAVLQAWIPAHAQEASRPRWNELTPAQREALAPLARDWPTLDTERKRKWLEVAERYPNLSPDGRKKMQERMAEFARLTPEQKRTARENFRRAYEVPAEQRAATVQRYQELPDDKKRELAGRAAARPEKPRRTGQPAQPARSAQPTQPGVKAARPPARTEPSVD